MNIEEFHAKLEECAREVLLEFGDHRPFLFCLIGEDHVFPVDLDLAMSLLPKDLAAKMCTMLVKSSDAMMAATVMETDLYKPPKGSRPTSVDVVPPGAQKSDALIIAVQTPGESRMWMYDIDVMEGGSRMLGSGEEIEKNLWNRFDLFPKNEVMS